MFSSLEAQSCALPALRSAEVIDTDDSVYREFVAVHYSAVEAAVAAASRRFQLTRDQTDELGSIMRLKIIVDRYAVLRKFKGESSLATYLTAIACRVWIDAQRRHTGKWRASIEATRLGRTAILLERLVVRDALSFDEAYHTLKITYGASEPREQIEEFYSRLPRRARRRMVSVDALRGLADPQGPAPDRSDAEAVAARFVQVARAVRSLPFGDRRVLTLRFVRGLTIARIACELQVEPKAMYRRFERILVRLRRLVAFPSSDRGDRRDRLLDF
jgi:RNA polymerase sigma factor (sigma-70 family)